MNRNILRAVIIFIAFSLAAVLTACKTEDITKRAENEEKVLQAMIEYPGDGLYDPVVTVIGIGVDEPSEEELAAAEQRAAEEKQLWQDKVGDCFADDCQALDSEFGITFSFSPLFKKLVIVLCLNESELFSFNRADFLHINTDFGVGHCKDNCPMRMGQIEKHTINIKTRF